MVKRIISAMLVAIMIVGLVGCNESNQKAKTKSKNDKSSDPNSPSSIVESLEDDENAVNMKTVTDEVEDEGSGLYLSTFTKNDESEFLKINSRFTLEGDTTVRDELKLGKYQLVWSDEFNGNSLSSFWSDYDSDSRGSDQLITMDAITVANGILKCTATRYYDPFNPNKKWRTAPSISTNYSMVFQHGYLEMRARLPYKQGAWPSFWLTSRSKSPSFRNDFPNALYTAELDVFEVINSVDMMQTTLHKWFVDGSGVHTELGKKGYTFTDTTNLCDEYHRYGVEWTTDEISLYLDGTKWHTFDLQEIYKADKDDTHGFDQYMKIILGVGTLISPNFKPEINITHLDQGDSPSDMPFEYCIDWIRLYQEPGKTAIQYLS